MRRPFTVYLEARQAQANEAVPDARRDAAATRLVRIVNVSLALLGFAGAGASILLGTATTGPVWWAVVAIGLAAGGGGVIGVMRLARRGTGPTSTA